MVSSVSVPASLASTVDAFWRFESGGKRERVLPDGCMDFVFELNSAKARLVGAMSRAELIEPAVGTRYFGVRFLPGVAALLIDAHAVELTDSSAELSQFLHASLRGLPEQVAATKSDAERVRLLERFLNASQARQRTEDARVRAATTELRRAAGALRVGELAFRVGVSERQLERLFHERVGVRPKLFARVMRLQRTMTLLRQRALPTQAALALEAGYADEPHLLRDFRELAAATPSEVAAEQHVGFVQGARP